MSRSEWDDDDCHELAPLPAHERTWRHPSEMAERAWQYSEPPLTLGRGLTMATGTIGCVLALAVLWTMVPTQAGRSANSSVRSTSAQRATSATTVRAEVVRPVVTTASTASGSLASGSAGGSSLPDSAIATTATPSLTYQVQGDSEISPVAIAVAVNGGSLVVTTAQAVSVSGAVTLMLPDGSVAAAQVLFVDDRSGLAVLAPQDASGSMAFVVAGDVAAGDELTLLGTSSERSFTVADDMELTAASFGEAPAMEGTPVVNQRGELVALCTHDAQGTARLVRLDSLDQLQAMLRSFGAAAPVWLGVVLNDDPSGQLSIGAIDPDGPAAAAGLASGDVIISIDGRMLSSGQALTDVLAEHVPGDVVEFVVRGNGAAERSVAVQLAAPTNDV